jgi:hypothetical protein
MIGIGAVFACLAGLVLLLIQPDAATLADAGLSRGMFQLIGFILLAIGLVEFLLIYALWDGSNTARIITTVLVGLSAFGSLVQVLTRAPGGVTAWFQLLLDIVILGGLWATPSATEFFGRRPAPAQVPPPMPSGGPLPPPPPI